MNVAKWEERITRYAKATHTTEELTDFRELAEAELAATVRADDFLQWSQYSVVGGVATLNARHAEIVAVEYGGAPLEAYTPGQAAIYLRSQSGRPLGYQKDTGRTLRLIPTPGDGATCEVWEFLEPEPVPSSGAHEFSDRYPSLYIAAALVHAYEVQRDYAAQAAARANVAASVETINALAQERIAARAMLRRTG